MRFPSLTTVGREFGVPMHLVERTILAIKKPAPNFWSKKECKRFDNNVYQLCTNLNRIFGKLKKDYSEDILLAAFNSLKGDQIKKLAKAAQWIGNTGKVIATLAFYCNEEYARAQRLEKPKDDDGAPEPIVFDPGEDLRPPSMRNSRRQPTLWKLIGDNNGT